MMRIRSDQESLVGKSKSMPVSRLLAFTKFKIFITITERSKGTLSSVPPSTKLKSSSEYKKVCM